MIIFNMIIFLLYKTQSQTLQAVPQLPFGFQASSFLIRDLDFVVSSESERSSDGYTANSAAQQPLNPTAFYNKITYEFIFTNISVVVLN
jgi:hypothetical protein